MTTKSLLPAAWDIPSRFRDRIGQKAGRQRAMFQDGHLLLVLHRPPRPEEDEREGRFYWRSPQGEWRSNEFGGGAAALTRHQDEFSARLEEYSKHEEAATTAEEYFDVLTGLAPVHRAALHMHNVLQEARKRCPDDRDIINFRDRAYDIERSAELLYNETKNALDFVVAKRAEEEARSSRQMAVSAHRLNIMAAFFFPLATICAIFGMTLKHGLEDAAPPFLFLTFLLIGLGMGAVLTYFIAKPQKNI